MIWGAYMTPFFDDPFLQRLVDNSVVSPRRDARRSDAAARHHPPVTREEHDRQPARWKKDGRGGLTEWRPVRRATRPADLLPRRV